MPIRKHKSKHYQNFVLGNNPQKWKSKVYSFNEVTYNDFYSGIDLIYKGLEGQLSYNFKIQPGAEVNQISFRLDRAENISLKPGEFAWFPWDSTVSLVADASSGTPVLEARIYQAAA